MDLTQFEIEIKRHAFERAMQRKVTPDMIEATLKGGETTRFGKNYVRFCKRYRKFSVVCVGQIINQRIKIITIATKKIKK